MMRTTLAIALVSVCMPLSVSAATIYLDPNTGTYGPGDTFITEVRLDNEGECINAVHVAVSYPTDRLRAVDFSRGNSILNLWIKDPTIDTGRGMVEFMGGIPGGYCGRIPGDPSLTNVLGRIVFSVVKSDASQAEISVSSESEAYLNDGLGSRAQLTVRGSSVTLQSEKTDVGNPWIEEVGADTTPPDPFTIEVQSTRGVFGGRYYIVFSTTDKQSGMDHYEIFERGAWKPVVSPYRLTDQSLKDIQVKAIDKAGNETLGTYVEGSAPPSQAPRYDLVTILALLVVLIILASVKLFIDRKKADVGTSTIDLRS